MKIDITDDIKEKAFNYVAPNVNRFAKRGIFDGDLNKKIIGYIGFLAVKKVFGLSLLETDEEIDGEPDSYDFIRDGKTFDVKTSFCYIYQKTGKAPPDWGILIPESQFRFKPHDYYIRCVVDGETLEEIHQCLILCVCERQAIENSPIVTEKMPVPMRVVPNNLTFPIEKILQPDARAVPEYIHNFI